MKTSLKDYLKTDLKASADSAGDKGLALVLGNEAGDLDTFVCSVSLAWHLNSKEVRTPDAIPSVVFELTE